jgi:hypothetical protein
MSSERRVALVVAGLCRLGRGLTEAGSEQGPGCSRSHPGRPRRGQPVRCEAARSFGVRDPGHLPPLGG